MRTGIKPGNTATEELDLQLTALEILPIHIRAFELTASRRHQDGGDISTRSTKTAWYNGPSLIEHLETVAVDIDAAQRQPFRMPVQWFLGQPAPS